MNQYQFSKIINKFHSALPVINGWIDQLIENNKDKSTPVIDLNFSRINQIFPKKLLEKAKVVIVPGKIPFPPLSQMGLTELSGIELMPIAGITFKDTFFVNQNLLTESLHFHELIHVVQWKRLGADNFLLAYGVGIIQFGYEQSPLEQIAYSLQKDFDTGTVPDGIVEIIYQRTDALWNQIRSLVSQ
ncbi:MAG: hypothetical protein JRI61_01695 [Deltaproteobacteria bacterium]|nr:hypothetical protein [Deltaproteobacteria bacterium]